MKIPRYMKSIGGVVILIIILMIGSVAMLTLGSGGSDNIGGFDPQSGNLQGSNSANYSATSVASVNQNVSFDRNAEPESGQSNQVERIIIRNAEMRVVSDDAEATVALITQLTEASGGWIVTSTQSTTGWDTINIRVPADQRADIQEQIKNNVREVEFERVTGEDVTAQYTDLESQLRNLELTETTLQTLMDDAENTQDVLAVYTELTDIRSQIEVIQGRLNFYDQSAAFSSITVNIIQYVDADDHSPVDEDETWKPIETAEESLEALVDTLRWLGDASIWLVTFVLPLVILAAIVFIPVNRIRRRWFVSQPAEEKSSSGETG